jgi:hypothetical protein
MELIEFEDTDLFPRHEGGVKVEVSTPIHITSEVIIEPQTEEQWRSLRDYVIDKIIEIHGPFPRKDAAKEAGIFKGFINRWGYANAMAIARAAFEAHGGMWYNSPIRVERFTKGSDPYFARQVAALLGIASAS